ncbi:uncharacterized protein (DUF305 family) [Haloactinopolyspora alba]|uniref:Uncharacterized protein (DUF305 family) n=1 Tax=Haloactinopolyspora alba TaxID=648780 RepID=A0A2P8EG59_9ACTN|nr:DUF305 domain-containing protein [Haloactinopolyspora alba]PSL08440.1 uncharacterized protein (DUF305 family) [Haloactinopolyspora alba]
MKFRRVAGALLATAGLIGTAGVSAVTATAEQPKPQASPSGARSEAAAQATANDADAQFVRMMIPHHFQALVMSRMAPSRGEDPELLALADRIDVEQDLEISMMQNWQGWHDLEVTDAEAAYQQVLQDPDLLEQMGMATPAELDQLSASTGTDFDILYLELMIEHHEGAMDMLVDVIINGNDTTLEGWATDMLTTQYTQIQQMEAMLDEKTS